VLLEGNGAVAEVIDGTVALIGLDISAGAFTGAVVFAPGAVVVRHEATAGDGRGAGEIIPIRDAAGVSRSGCRDVPVLPIPKRAAGLIGDGAVGVIKLLDADDLGAEGRAGENEEREQRVAEKDNERER